MQTESIQVGWHMQGSWQETEFCGYFEHSPFTLYGVTNILSDVVGRQMYVMVDGHTDIIPIDGNNFYESLPDGIRAGDMVAIFDGQIMHSRDALRLKYRAAGREHEYDNRIAAGAATANLFLNRLREMANETQA